MLARLLPVVAILQVVGFLTGCVSGPPKHRGPIFKDLKTENRVEYLQNKLKVDPSSAEDRTELARMYLSEDMIEEAITQLEGVLINDPQHLRAYLLLSLALQKRPKPDLLQASRLLEKAVQISPDNADAHLHLGQVYEKRTEEKKALSEFDRVVELSKDPSTLVSAYLGLMAIYKKRGESEKANNAYEEVRKIYPDVDELIKQAEISRITPPPKYAGDELRGDDGIHPSHEERMNRLREIIKWLPKETK